ncbi:MAG: tRNA (guanosine(37)-N1)-methyltransferase TrmD [Candidatus Competibacteraceae bacterium]|nr:tRNA (guanosine(37)-N1)-methyltransferase TrmD [Candidatus Competibacteraceae bacterium]MCB1806839.1 tRNA (guanosine(37)-N1)-methyltransferase TrmD [Candidatus Competibacteraceae bacterium]MCB1811861.1 tRNA (guanosine(37)-N1)-methyltransferase TrmD [Candidatus Competibacteraceae bacterium]
MRIDVITLFPEMLTAVRDFGISGRAIARGLVSLNAWNPRDYTQDRHRTVDDRPYGGGPGMVLKVQPLRAALHAARSAANSQGTVLSLSPQGRRLSQNWARELSKLPHLILIAGRYEGIDERFTVTEVDQECSIGDYVLSGGELAAMIVIDAVIRLLPGTLGDAESAQQDSFMEGLLDYPHFTRPEQIDDLAVPPVLLSGDHDAIRRWRLQQSLGRTWLRRPELLESLQLDAEQQQLLTEFIRDYNGQMR